MFGKPPAPLGGFMVPPRMLPQPNPRPAYSTWKPPQNFSKPSPATPALGMTTGVSTYVPPPTSGITIPPPNMTTPLLPSATTGKAGYAPTMSSTMLIDGCSTGFMDDSDNEFQAKFNETLAKSSGYVREQDDTISSIWRSIGIQGGDAYQSGFNTHVQQQQQQQQPPRSAGSSAYVPMSRNAQEEILYRTDISKREPITSTDRPRRSRSRSPFGTVFLGKINSRDDGDHGRPHETQQRGREEPVRYPATSTRSPNRHGREERVFERRASPALRGTRVRSPSPLGDFISKLISSRDDRDGGAARERASRQDSASASSASFDKQHQELTSLRRSRQQLMDDGVILAEQSRLHPHDMKMKQYVVENATMQLRLTAQISQLEQSLARVKEPMRSERTHKHSSSSRHDEPVSSHSSRPHSSKHTVNDTSRRDDSRSEKDRRDSGSSKRVASASSKQQEPKIKKQSVIYRDGGDHWCQECDVTLSTVRDLLVHLKTSEHIKRLSRKVPPWVSEKPDILPNATEATMKGTEFLLPCDGFYCELCKVFTGDKNEADMHLRSYEHNRIYSEHIDKYPSYERNLQTRKREATRKREENERRKAERERRQAEAERQKKEELEKTQQVKKSMSVGLDSSLKSEGSTKSVLEKSGPSKAKRQKTVSPPETATPSADSENASKNTSKKSPVNNSPSVPIPVAKSSPRKKENEVSSEEPPASAPAESTPEASAPTASAPAKSASAKSAPAASTRPVTVKKNVVVKASPVVRSILPRKVLRPTIGTRSVVTKPLPLAAPPCNPCEESNETVSGNLEDSINTSTNSTQGLCDSMLIQEHIILDEVMDSPVEVNTSLDVSANGEQVDEQQ